MNENIIWNGRPEWKDSTLALILSGLWILLSLYGLFRGAPKAAMMILCCFGLVIFGAVALKRFSYKYIVTSSRIIANKGIISRYTGEIDIRDIRTINVNQGMIQRLVGTGDISFTSASGIFKEVNIVGIDEPFKVKELIRSHKTEHDGKTDRTG